MAVWTWLEVDVRVLRVNLYMSLDLCAGRSAGRACDGRVWAAMRASGRGVAEAGSFADRAATLRYGVTDACRPSGDKRTRRACKVDAMIWVSGLGEVCQQSD